MLLEEHGEQRPLGELSPKSMTADSPLPAKCSALNLALVLAFRTQAHESRSQVSARPDAPNRRAVAFDSGHRSE
jgi:hypothetical protein